MATFTWKSKVGSFSDKTQWTPTGVPKSGDLAIIPGGVATITQGSTLDGLRVNFGSLGATIKATDLTVGATTTLTAVGFPQIASTGLLTNDGSIFASGSLTITESGETGVSPDFINEGVVAVTGKLTVVNGHVTNDGTLDISGGLVTVNTDFIGTAGTVLMSGDTKQGTVGTADMHGLICNQTFQFLNGNATLQLAGNASLQNVTLQDFQAGDQLVLPSSETAADVKVTATSLTIGQYTFNLQNSGPGFDAASVTVKSDGQGGTVLTTSYTPCFATGTRLLSPEGYVPVEQVRPGDLLMTASGVAQRVTWVGHREARCVGLARPELTWPVRVRADAFGAGVPERDVVLSPDHAVFFAGALVPIKHLIDGKRIVQEPVDTITYWHVELPSHDVLVADGLPTESYLDIGDRARFAVDTDAPESGALVALEWESRGCAPLHVTGPVVLWLRRSVRAKAAYRERMKQSPATA